MQIQCSDEQRQNAQNSISGNGDSESMMTKLRVFDDFSGTGKEKK
jgi:hypothetical protein